MEELVFEENSSVAVGLAASGSLPVASAEDINAAYCLGFLRAIRDVAFATVDEAGLPSVRIIDVMRCADGKLFFLVPRGKAFHAELVSNPVVAIVGQTTDFRMCRLRGIARRARNEEERKRLVNGMFAMNPGMEQLYPGEARRVIDAFWIEDAEGEYFDLGQKPIVRVSFVLGEGLSSGERVYCIDSERCDACGACARSCPQSCIELRADSTYAIRQSACLRCGLCAEDCPRHAIFVGKGECCER